VVYVDVALRIFDHTVRVAVLDSGGKLAPIVDYLVGVCAVTQDGEFGFGFGSHTQK
jgi:hypothetical protein